MGSGWVKIKSCLNFAAPWCELNRVLFVTACLESGVQVWTQCLHWWRLGNTSLEVPLIQAKQIFLPKCTEAWIRLESINDTLCSWKISAVGHDSLYPPGVGYRRKNVKLYRCRNWEKVSSNIVHLPTHSLCYNIWHMLTGGNLGHSVKQISK